MAAGDLTASAPALVDATDGPAIKTAIDALNLAATTDNLYIIPLPGTKLLAIFKVERAAA